MKENKDKQKGKEAVSALLQKASALGRKASEFGKQARDAGKAAADRGMLAVANVQAGAKTLAERTASESYQRRLKKYNPLFPDRYFSEDFHLPNMIMIVDDAVRRGIDVCEGSIGWLRTEKDKSSEMEILCLYDEAVEMSGLTFIPAATCDAVYYVDSFDRKKFIRVDTIFKKAHEERLAELEHIAYSLGAKNYAVVISESVHEKTVSKKKVTAKETGKTAAGNASVSEQMEQSSTANTGSKRSGRTSGTFECSGEPQMPQLKWFAHDDTIKGLIEMRLSAQHMIKAKTLELFGSSSAAMSQKTAYTIDSTLGKLGFKGSLNMESQQLKESESKLYFTIEF